MKKIITFCAITILNFNINNLFSFFDNDVCFKIKNNQKICEKINDYSFKRYYIKKGFLNNIIYPENESEYNYFKSLFKIEFEEQKNKLSKEFQNTKTDKNNSFLNFICIENPTINIKIKI